MSRDYAKRSTFKKRSNIGYRFLWLIILLLGTAFITSLIMPDKFQKYGAQLREIGLIKKILNIPTSQKEAAATKTEIKEVITKTVTAPKFDFYSIVPKFKDNKDKKDKKNNTPEITYELSIAVVENFAVADRLKAELALLGFAASITPIYQNNLQKHYVSIGPYDSKENAIADQQKLKINTIKSELKKLR